MNFKEEVKKLNIELTSEMELRFNKYYDKLIEVNSYMNLTAITDKEEVFVKHFLDSLYIIKALDLNQNFSICDVGSGAGFPSIPLAIVCNNAQVTIIDALNKRIKFLNELTSYLDLNNVNAYHKRAEDYVKEVGQSFDFVTARAVARLNVLCELCMPLVKINGYFIAMKGQSSKEELDEALNAINILGGKIVDSFEFELPADAGKRSIIIIKKVKDTPKKYPRQFAKIKERPL